MTTHERQEYAAQLKREMNCCQAVVRTFDDTPPAEKSRLYAAVDALNARYGNGKVFSARHSLTLGLARSNREPRLRGGYAQGLGARSWHMKRQKLSRRPTTRWDELMTVR